MKTVSKTTDKAAVFWRSLSDLASRDMMEKPHFSGSWVASVAEDCPPADSRENRYLRTDLFPGRDGKARLYRVAPYEYNMEAEEVDTVRSVIGLMQSVPPPRSVLDDEKRLRNYSEGLSRKLISKRALPGDPSLLSRICAQYSTGYGTLEHLLRDERVQDIYIDPPPETSPVYVTLGGHMDPSLQGTYPTNVFLTSEEMERIVSILRYHSDRPFSEANPTLECDLELYNARATAVGPPLSPNGTSLAIRKHSHDPWTVPGLVRAGSMTPLAAAFLDLALDGRATMLVAGPRGAGKTSLLGALLFEVDRDQRIIVLEDTPELPSTHLRGLGYKVLPLLFGEAKGTSPEKVLRTALRLGESVIVMGEVRGPETRVLYEAMSAGTAGSSVLGTFHADSAKAVFKRVVEDMGVPPGSFMSTDLVIVSGLVQPHGTKLKLRRVVQISEVVKDAAPGTFRDLFLYDPSADTLSPTPELKQSGTLRRIASMWGSRPSDLLSEIKLREAVLKRAMAISRKDGDPGPEAAVRISESFGRVREMAISKGFISDHDRFLALWEKDHIGGGR